MENVGLSRTFWQQQRVLLTGHTGFKGAWLSLWLQQWGATVHGYALAPPTTPSLYMLANTRHGMSETIADITDSQRLRQIFSEVKPTIVLHLAAQAIVAEGYRDPVRTWQSNVMGTLNVLECLRDCESLQAAVIVTTDKVYRNDETGRAFVETDALGGHDPYSASKAACEVLCQSHCSSFLNTTALATARAGNVIGGGDFAPRRLLPDIVRAWTQQQAIELRAPNAVRPWQHVFESLHGYLRLAQGLAQHSVSAGAYNFGPDVAQTCSVNAMIERIQCLWPDNSGFTVVAAPFKEAQQLMLNSSKAHTQLQWHSLWDLDVSLQRSVEWYRAWAAGDTMREISVQQLQQYWQLL